MKRGPGGKANLKGWRERGKKKKRERVYVRKKRIANTGKRFPKMNAGSNSRQRRRRRRKQETTLPDFCRVLPEEILLLLLLSFFLPTNKQKKSGRVLAQSMVLLSYSKRKGRKNDYERKQNKRIKKLEKACLYRNWVSQLERGRRKQERDQERERESTEVAKQTVYETQKRKEKRRKKERERERTLGEFKSP